MDGQVLAALITAGSSLTIAGASGIWAITQRAKAKKLESQTLAAAEAFEAQLLARYGFKINSVHTRVEITDYDGSCKINREHRGVHITHEGIALACIPGLVWNNNPNAKITLPPEMIGTPTNIGKDVTLKHIRVEEKKCDFQIEITGSLMHGDPELNYGYTYEYSGAFLMTKEEEAATAAIFKKEYFMYDVMTPTDKVIIEVVFPAGYSPGIFPGVTISAGISEGLMHNIELKRVIGGFEKNNRGAIFTIDKPLIGFTYLLYWDPLPKKTVDLLRPRT